MLFDITSTVLDRRGITDKEAFLNPSSKSVISYKLLKNIDKAVDTVAKHLKLDSKFLICPDSDADGFCSASILIMYLKKLNPDINLVYVMHDKRANGLTDQIMKGIDSHNPDIVIMPDASSNDHRQHEELYNKGIDVICLDHHEISDGESKYATVVNPQISPLYENKQLSGTTVTYKFLQALDYRYSKSWADYYLDLVAFSNVTDAISVVPEEIRYLNSIGFNNINNPFLKELAFKNAWHTRNNLYPLIISWGIAPKINALIRVGSMEEKEDAFRAMMEESEEFYNTRTKKTEKLYEKATRLCTNLYAKQKRIRLKLIEEISEKIESEGLDDNAFIVLKMDEFESGLSGYIAGGLTNTYRKNVLLMTWNEKKQMYMGSLRGFSGADITDVKGFLEGLRLFNFVAGHSAAAGIGISKENAEILNDEINKKLKFADEKTPIEVDFEIVSKALTSDLIDEFVSVEHYWGKSCEEPKIAIKNVEIECDNITYGNIMKTNKGNIELMSFINDLKLQELTEQGRKIAVVDIVGTFSLNRFLGKTTHQVKMEDILIKEIKDAPAFGFQF